MASVDILKLNEQIQAESQFLGQIQAEVRKVIVGQELLVERLLIGLLTQGHILLEGVPGLAKTLSVQTLARTIDCRFQRIQFTPDLLPADLIGTLIYNPKTGEFYPRKGPVFANIVLADEINRAPAKVQSALLEAMQERQVTIGDNTYPLAEPFLVLATQNPIEQEGTYPLPEAQVDRFMLKLKVVYPSRKEEREILDRMATAAPDLPVRRWSGPSRSCAPATWCGSSTWTRSSRTTSSTWSSPPASRPTTAWTWRRSSPTAPRPGPPSSWCGRPWPTPS